MTDINSGEKGFTFTWRIKNISYCWHNRGDVLVSPTFSVADLQHSSWSLLLYPRGHANEDGYLSVVLRREKTGGPETLTPSFELSLISTDGSSLLSFYVEEGEVFFSKNYNNDFNGDGTYKFVTREEVFCSKKSIYLPSDTLTVCCRMWKERCVDRTVHMFAKTVINTETCFSHEVLHKLLGHSKVITVTSSKGCPVLSIDVSSWSESHLKKDISATITNKRSLENGPFNCDLYFVHTSGEKIKCGEIDNRFEEHINDTWELNLWFPKTLLIDKNFECLTEDWFLQCEGIFGTKSKTANIERIVYGIPSNLAVDMIREFPGTPSVLDDLKSIYLDKIFCDVTLSTQTAKFKAHKTILCARSDVFKSLLTNKRSNSIEIEDFDDDTVQSLLMFLYTDTTEDMQWSMANKLYKAAIYYKVHLLKWRCSDILMENLNAHNAIEALVLTNEYQDTNLRSAVDTFILAHDEDIFVSEEWMAFTQTHPQLAMKTMILKYEIKKKKKERICSTDTSTDCDSTDSDISTMVFTETENSEKLSSGIRKELDDYPNIVEDLNTLYDLQVLCDVHLKTRTKSFPTHKAILCARSSVFRAMITSDMSRIYRPIIRSITRSIQVEDLDDDIVHLFLKFLYTDTVEKLQWENAIKLYYAADKYEIKRLKAECSSFLKDNISSFKAMELLLLADMHQDLDLKTFAEDYILRMEDYIFGSDQWGAFIESNPLIAAQTMRLKYLKVD